MENICPDQETLLESISCEEFAGPFYYDNKLIADNIGQLKGWIRRNGYFPDIYHISDHGNVDLCALKGNNLEIVQSWV